MPIGKAYQHSTLNDIVLKHYGALEFITLFLDDNPHIDSLTYLFSPEEEYVYREGIGDLAIKQRISYTISEYMRSRTVNHVKIVPDSKSNDRNSNLKAHDYGIIEQNPEENYFEENGVIKEKEITPNATEDSLVSRSKRYLLNSFIRVSSGMPNLLYYNPTNRRYWRNRQDTFASTARRVSLPTQLQGGTFTSTHEDLISYDTTTNELILGELALPSVSVRITFYKRRFFFDQTIRLRLTAAVTFPTTFKNSSGTISDIANKVAALSFANNRLFVALKNDGVFRIDEQGEALLLYEPTNEIMDISIIAGNLYELSKVGGRSYMTTRKLNSQILSPQVLLEKKLQEIVNVGEFSNPLLGLTNEPNGLYAATRNIPDNQSETLIPISTLEQLNTMRYDLNGDGVPAGTNTQNAAYNTAFDGVIEAGVTYNGYRLVNNLDFQGSQWENPNGGTFQGTRVTTGFPTIGTNNNRWRCVFDGSGYTIRGLYKNTSLTGTSQGFFRRIDSTGIVRNVIFDNAVISVGSSSGIVAARNDGAIHAVIVSGSLEGVNQGAITSTNYGSITECISYVDVTSTSATGLMTRINQGTMRNCMVAGSGFTSSSNLYVFGAGALSTVENCLCTATLSAPIIFVFESSQTATIINSYYDSDVAGFDTQIGAQTTNELQSLTSYTGIYAQWDRNVWNLQTSLNYPDLRISDYILQPIDPIDGQLLPFRVSLLNQSFLHPITFGTYAFWGLDADRGIIRWFLSGVPQGSFSYTDFVAQAITTITETNEELLGKFVYIFGSLYYYSNGALNSYHDAVVFGTE